MEQELIDYEPPMVVEVGDFEELTRWSAIGSGYDNQHQASYRNGDIEF